jgi:hypothetical protein
MPFRRFFAERGSAHPVVYSMLTLAAGMIACMAIAVSISVSASNRAIRQNQQQQVEQSREAREATCYLVRLQVKVFDENNPITPTGRDLAEAWREAARVYGCL